MPKKNKCNFQQSYTSTELSTKQLVEVCKSEGCNFTGYKLGGMHFRRKTVDRFSGKTIKDWENDA